MSPCVTSAAVRPNARPHASRRVALAAAVVDVPT